MKRVYIVLLSTFFTLGSGCGDDDEESSTARALPSTSHGRTKLRWKRFRAIQNDLARALELDARSLCVERNGAQCASGGRVSLTDWLRSQSIPEADIEAECKLRQDSETCVDGDYIPFDNPQGAHVIALGGNNTFLAGVHDAIPEPIVNTPIAIDRVLLTACGERAALDAEGPPTLFTALDFSASTIAAGSAGLAETVEMLYQRLLARNPTDEESAAILSMLSEGPMKVEEFARLACFAVGSQQEFVFQ